MSNSSGRNKKQSLKNAGGLAVDNVALSAFDLFRLVSTSRSCAAGLRNLVAFNNGRLTKIRLQFRDFSGRSYFCHHPMSTLALPYATLTFKSPVVHIVYASKVELGLFEIRDLIAHSEKLSGGQPYLVLADARGGLSVTPQGRRIASDVKEAPLHRGTAVLVNARLLAVAMNFFEAWQRPPYPYRAFTTEAEAMSWLGKQMDQDFGNGGFKQVG